MLEYETAVCPFCNKEIKVKVFRQFKNVTYVVSENCPYCKGSSEKIENLLNHTIKKRLLPKVEKSYIKLGMKDRK